MAVGREWQPRLARAAGLTAAPGGRRLRLVGHWRTLAASETRRGRPGGSCRQDGAIAPWPYVDRESTLVSADLGYVFIEREECEVNTFAAAIDGDVVVTADGYRKLCAELETLRTVRRQELTEYVRDARADRDPDNPMLFDLLEEQAKLEGRINFLDAQVALARIAGPANDGTAGIGSCVRVRNCGNDDVAEYYLVGAVESDVSVGRVSVEAPVGRALLGRRGGETVSVETPLGTMRLERLSVSSIVPRAVKWAA